MHFLLARQIDFFKIKTCTIKIKVLENLQKQIIHNSYTALNRTATITLYWHYINFNFNFNLSEAAFKILKSRFKKLILEFK